MGRRDDAELVARRLRRWPEARLRAVAEGFGIFESAGRGDLEARVSAWPPEDAMADPDETQVPDPEPTRPDLRRLRCPECRGEGYRLREVETREDGTLHRAVAKTCDLCRGEKTVDRATFRRWHAKREGRPE